MNLKTAPLRFHVYNRSVCFQNDDVIALARKVYAHAQNLLFWNFFSASLIQIYCGDTDLASMLHGF